MTRATTAQIHRRLAAEEILLPPGVTPAGSRGVILSVALRLFAEHGFGGTSVRDIAKETGLQPATMYAHYHPRNTSWPRSSVSAMRNITAACGRRCWRASPIRRIS
jgi:hypothetical protein